jgi:zinc transport system permease protein
MLEFFLETQFIQRGIIAGILVSVICPIIGSFLVVRRLSLISEALSHVTLAGVGFGLLMINLLAISWLNPLYFGLLFSIAGAFFIDRLRLMYRQYQEISIPIVLSVGVGLGVILISMANGFNASFLHFLFGSIVSVTKADLLFIWITTGIVLLIFLLFYKQMLSIAFDEEFARISGIPRKLINLIFSILVALAISMAMRVVGILLVSSLITIPVAASLRLATSFKQVIFYSVIIAQSSMLSGIILGYYFEIATGGMVVVMAIFHLLGILGIQVIRARGLIRGTGHER